MRRSAELSTTAENSSSVGVGTSGAEAWMRPKSAYRYWAVSDQVRESAYSPPPPSVQPVLVARAEPRALAPGSPDPAWALSSR